MATTPSSCAGTLPRDPLKAATGVRAAPTITTSVMMGSTGSGWRRDGKAAADDRDISSTIGATERARNRPLGSAGSGRGDAAEPVGERAPDRRPGTAADHHADMAERRLQQPGAIGRAHV